MDVTDPSEMAELAALIQRLKVVTTATVNAALALRVNDVPHTFFSWLAYISVAQSSATPFFTLWSDEKTRTLLEYIRIQFLNQQITRLEYLAVEFLYILLGKLFHRTDAYVGENQIYATVLLSNEPIRRLAQMETQVTLFDPAYNYTADIVDQAISDAGLQRMLYSESVDGGGFMDAPIAQMNSDPDARTRIVTWQQGITSTLQQQILSIRGVVTTKPHTDNFAVAKAHKTNLVFEDEGHDRKTTQ